MVKTLQIASDATRLFDYLGGCELQTGTVCWRANRISADRIVFQPYAKTVLYHNSFVPIVNCSVRRAEQNTELTLSFSLQKGVQILSVLIACFAVLLEGVMLYLHRSKGQIEGFALAIPPLILLFQALLTVAGVSISNRRFMTALRRTLREAARQH